jgi:hypothetical protein
MENTSESADFSGLKVNPSKKTAELQFVRPNGTTFIVSLPAARLVTLLQNIDRIRSYEPDLFVGGERHAE